MTTPDDMIAARKIEDGVLRVERVPRPTLTDGRALVRVTRASICGSDIHSVDEGLGPLGWAERSRAVGFPGHEAVGVVVDPGTTDLPLHARVLLLEPGTYSEFFAAHPGQCVVLPGPAELPDRQAIIAQPLGVAIYAMDRYLRSIGEARDTAAVIGCGAIGNLFVQLCRLAGFATIIAVDLSGDRLERAEQAGATHTVLVDDPHSDVAVERILGLTDGLGARLVIEAAGPDRTRSQSVLATAQHGCAGLFGYPEADEPRAFPFAEAFWRSPLSIEIVKGAQQEPGLVSFHRAIELLLSSEVDAGALDVTEYDIDDINRAYDDARQRRSLKCQLLFPEHVD